MIKSLSLKQELAYASGMMGWSIMTNLIIVMLPYFYIPPINSGLPSLLPQLVFFGIFNLISIIAASGRLIDALYDPFIASKSDSSTNKLGRRIPFMFWAIIPAVVCCGLVFHPIARSPVITNAWWLGIMLCLFFVAATTYIIPYNALLPEVTHNAKSKVKLSSFQQVGFVLGIIFSALTNNFADGIQNLVALQRIEAVQYTIWILSIFAGICMFLPILFIKEKDFSVAKPSHIPLIPAIKNTFKNLNFKYYLISDFAYYTALSIISSGLLFFVTVLLGLPESEGGKFMGVMVLTSLLFYPFINWGAAKYGKKPFVLIAFAILSCIFITIYFLGKLPFGAYTQIYLLVISASFPLAALGILPTAILAEIAQTETQKTGKNQEGMFFAVKYLFVKLGQTLGIALFAMLTIYGKDPGNDFGLRLNGLVGFLLCLLAFIFFLKFKENKSPN